MLKTVFKLLTGAFAVIGLLAALVVSGAVWFASSRMHKPPKVPDKIVLVLDFREELSERDDTMPDFRSLLSFVAKERPGRTTVREMVQALRNGSKDQRVIGAVGLFGANLPHLAQAQEIRAALEKFRAAGKFTIAYSTSYGAFGPGNNAYYMASAFEKIWLQPVGNVGLSGMRMENPFGRSVLDKLGVKAEFVQREEYKSAMAFITEDKMPPAMREEMQTILNSLNDQVSGGIAASRGMKADDVKALMAKGPYTAKEALALKLIDKIGYTDEIEAWIDETHGKKTAKLRPGQYVRLPDTDKSGKPVVQPPLKAPVALIVAQGEIAEDGGGPSPLSGGEPSMDTREIVGAFSDAVEDKDVKIIVFRVDSPGGSPTASETIRRAVVRAQQQGKKVIVSMGLMAGSGGYWIAMNADRIIANPATLTGSIGVLSGKINLGGLYEKLGLNWEILQTGADYSGMWSSTHGYTPEEKARLDVLIDDAYDAFRENVSAARKIPKEKMPGVSKGRVFTGEQAVRLGLVDELGGLQTAFDYAKTSLGMKPEDRLAVRSFPRQTTPAERVRDLLKELFGMEEAALTPTLQQLQGYLWRVSQPRTLALMPPFRFQ